MKNSLTRWFRTGIVLKSLLAGVCGIAADARATCRVDYVLCRDCTQDDNGNFSATLGSTPTFKAKSVDCSISDVTWTVTKRQNGDDDGWSIEFSYHSVQLAFSYTFKELGQYDVHVRFDPEGAEKQVGLQIRKDAFTVNIVPSAGCAVMAGDGGVDVVETPNGIACSGGMAADDPLCIEQFENSSVATLKVVPEPGFVFTGWTVNGAQMKTAAAPLLLTTMPTLASLADVLLTETTIAVVGINCETPTGRLDVMSIQHNQPGSALSATEKTTIGAFLPLNTDDDDYTYDPNIDTMYVVRIRTRTAASSERPIWCRFVFCQWNRRRWRGIISLTFPRICMSGRMRLIGRNRWTTP